MNKIKDKWNSGNNYEYFMGKIELDDFMEIQEQTPLISSTGGIFIWITVAKGLVILLYFIF